MQGENTSQLMKDKMKPTKWFPIVKKTLQRSHSAGCIGYYLNNDNGWRTRIFIHNYFALLNDGPFEALWEVSWYKQDGTLANKKSGEFNGTQTAIIEMCQIDGLDKYGITQVHVTPKNHKYTNKQPYSSLFFSEYYIPETNQSVMAHSLSGAIKASHCMFNHIGTGFITPVGFRPYIFVGNSCGFAGFKHTICGGGFFTFINNKKEKKVVEISQLKSRGCKKIDLFEVEPTLKDHLGHDPYTVELEGKNILAIPFLFQTNKHNHALAEHL